MAAFTTIAAATVSIGGSVAKGALAGDAAKTAAREAGRLRLEQEQLEKESVARLEQNFYDAVRATTDVYDKQLERGNVMGAQILEAVQEGDQRGVAAAAGKVKQIQDATLSDTADKFAKHMIAELIIKLDIPIDFAKREFGLSPYVKEYPSMSKMVEMVLRTLVNEIKDIKKSGGEFTDIQDHPMVKKHLKDLERFI